MPGRMHGRRLTYFPTTGNHVDSNTSVIPKHTSKRKLDSEKGATNLNQQTRSKLAKSLHRVYMPVDKNPEELYQCIYLVDPEGKRPYCLAQEMVSNNTELPYRVVMIRRSVERVVIGTSRPHPNLLNIINVFRFNASLFTVFDRPGLALSDIAISHAPQLGIPEIKTISTEALSGICALGDAGLFLLQIELENVYISGYDGRVKIGFDNATHQGLKGNGEAIPFKVMLEDLVACLPSLAVVKPSEELCAFIQSAHTMAYSELLKVDYLKHSLPARSLIPFVLTAQVSVMSLEHVTDTHIVNLRETEDYI